LGTNACPAGRWVSARQINPGRVRRKVFSMNNAGDTMENIVIGRIKEEGPLTFEQFMEMALYYPALGYYTSARDKIGPGGDFYTGPELHPVFGWTLAEQFAEMWEVLGRPRRWHLVEYGAGTGTLAIDVLGRLRDSHPACFDGVAYSIIEVSPPFVRRQKAALQRAGLLGKVVWGGGPAGDGCAEGGEGVIFSNELVDALPFHRVRAGGDGLKEIYVDHRGGRFTELLGPPSLPEVARYFQAEGVCLEVGQTAEVNLQAGRWIQAVAGRLKRGFVLTVDYGATAAELYTPSRYHGTMRCFERHSLADNPYETIGRRDITASVNFSSLIRWGEESGLKTAGLVSQADFLVNAGILELIRGCDDYQFDEKAYRDTEAVKKLILPGSMGQVFRVLIQCAGFTGAPSLRGTARRLSRTG